MKVRRQGCCGEGRMSWDEGVETELLWEGGPGMRALRQSCCGEGKGGTGIERHGGQHSCSEHKEEDVQRLKETQGPAWRTVLE